MAVIRLTDDMRRIVAHFVDNPPQERLDILAALAYVQVISAYWVDQLKEGNTPEQKDSALVLKMSQALAEVADSQYTTPKFWSVVQEQLTKIHPGLLAKEKQ
jgi:hypothetical protein